jgi:hypothetical protein
MRVVLALGLALVAILSYAVPAARAASGPADSQASEMVRLINGVRWANDLPALRYDPALANLARDAPISCPADASQVMLGRAKDFATYGPPSHYLRLCPSVMFVSVLQSVYGYGSNGEIDLSNLNYGTGARLLTYTGYLGGKHTWQTWTYYTNQAGILGWMASATHRDIIVGSYDRVGCGGWIGGDGTFFYDCLFSNGGPGPTMAPPMAAPFNNSLPTAQPTPAPTPKPTPRPTPVATAVAKVGTTATPTESPPPPDPTPAASSTLAATATPSSSPTGSPVSGASAAQQSGARPAVRPQGSGAGGSMSGAPVESSIVGVAAMGLAGLLAASYGLLVALRRRGRRGTGAS